MYRLILAALVLAATARVADAGTTTTHIVGKFEARNAAGVMIGNTQGYDTLAQCEAVLPVPTTPGKHRAGTCKLVHHIDKELNCDDAVKPALATFTVTDPAGVIYRGPYCALGETCVLPAGWELERNVTTFTEVGGLRFNADDTVDEYLLVRGDPPNECWAWKWVRQGAPPVLQMSPEARETWLTSDVSPTEVDDPDGAGLGVNDPPWGAP
jgi:hypothetical protein